MKFYEVSPVTTIATDKPTLTYHCDELLQTGQLVRISIGKRVSNGVVIEEVKKPIYNTKPIEEVIAAPILPSHLIELASWLSSYYGTPLPLVWQTILPNGLQKSRRTKVADQTKDKIKELPRLNESQADAMKILTRNPKGSVLLHGITGSGKTMVYISRAKELKQQGKSSIIMVPEIGLTSQLVNEFKKYISPVFVTHSRMTESERHVMWQQIAEHDGPCVIVGPRSALFSPRNDIGLVVADEFHEPSYKQDQSPKYSAIRAASSLAHQSNAQVILGSATPSVQDYYLADTKGVPVIKLDSSFNDVKEAKMTVVDLKKEPPTHKGWLSNSAHHAIKTKLQNERQILIFHNRRGTAAMSLCSECGWTSKCPNCYLPLTLHADWHQLRCHICNYKTKPPTSCPDCGNAEVTFKGLGTKQIESDIISLFPGAKVARFDTDVAKDQTLEARYNELRSGKIDILIGTQTIAKGLDLPLLELVIIPLADVGLYIPDFSASERTFQLIHQVAGRVGRHSNNSEVIVQSYTPDHPAIQQATHGDYKQFYEDELAQRRLAKYPPYVHLLKITAEYASAKAAKDALITLGGAIQRDYTAVKVMGPAPAFHERFRDRYRWQIVVKARSRQTLLKIVDSTPSRYQIDIDPSNLL